MTDDFDLKLHDALKLEPRPRDLHFASRVNLAIAEQERYLAWRRRAMRKFTGEAACALAIGGALLTLTQMPALYDALEGMNLVAWFGVLALPILWIAINSNRSFALRSVF